MSICQKSNFCIKKDSCQKNLCQYQHGKNNHGDASSSQIFSNHEGSKKEIQLMNEIILSDEYIEMCL